MANRENMEKWAAALESGEYEQGTGKLCRVSQDGTRQYCCLGVACEVAIANGVQIAVSEPYDVTSYDREIDYLPVTVREWLGIPSANPVLHGEDGGKHSSGYWNDTAGATFAKIAAMIRGTFLSDTEQEH